MAPPPLSELVQRRARPDASVRINGVIYAFNPSLNGNITGPGTAGSGNLLSFNGTVGNIVQDSSISAMGGGFGQIATAFFYESQGAKINRLNDRLLLGATATVQDGNNPPSPLTWVGQQAANDYTYLDSLSQFEVISTIGGVAGAFAARSSDILPDTWTGCFGIVTLGLNDSPLGLEAWGIYAPAFMADASGLHRGCGDGRMRGGWHYICHQQRLPCRPVRIGDRHFGGSRQRYGLVGP